MIRTERRGWVDRRIEGSREEKGEMGGERMKRERNREGVVS